MRDVCVHGGTQCGRGVRGVRGDAARGAGRRWCKVQAGPGVWRTHLLLRSRSQCGTHSMSYCGRASAAVFHDLRAIAGSMAVPTLRS